VEAVVDGNCTIMMAVSCSDKTEGSGIRWSATTERMYVGEEVEWAFLLMIWIGRLSACALVDSRTSER
jgi:hypothetical protein